MLLLLTVFFLTFAIIFETTSGDHGVSLAYMVVSQVYFAAYLVIKKVVR